MGVADLPGQPAVFKPNKWPISPKYAYSGAVASKVLAIVPYRPPYGARTFIVILYPCAARSCCIAVINCFFSKGSSDYFQWGLPDGFELFIPMFREQPQGQVKVTEKILELIS